MPHSRSFECVEMAQKSKGPNPPSPPFSDKSLSDMLTTDAERIVDAARQRLKLWDIPDEQINRIKETGKPIRTLKIYSPVNGYVVQKIAIQGMRVCPARSFLIWLIYQPYG